MTRIERAILRCAQDDRAQDHRCARDHPCVNGHHVVECDDLFASTPSHAMSETRPHTILGLSPRTWRQWHRWIGFPAAVFLLFVAITGILVAFTEFFGEEEALREATRDLISPVTVSSAPSAYTDPVSRALATAAQAAPMAPVDKMELQ